MTDKPMPVNAQAAAVRALVGNSKARNKTFEQKLDAILADRPDLAKGVEKVRAEGEKPRVARSGSGPLPRTKMAGSL